jgi:hypothetical protein
MRLRDRPLLVDGVDADLYVGRPKLEASVVEPLLEGRNVLILGEAGAGKSTLLRKVASDLGRRGRPAIIINGAIADDAAEFLELVEAALHDPQAEGSRRSAPPDAPPARLLSGARRLQRDHSSAILVDDLTDPKIAYDVFGRLRDELWNSDHSWAVAVRPRDSAALRTPPADAFWSRVCEVPALTCDEMTGLLHKGLSVEELKQIEQERPNTGTYPRNLIRWARDRLEGRRSGSPKRYEWPSSIPEGIGRSDAMALAELQGLGRPVSAHDPEVLARLRWSRPYAQRVLSRLEDQGMLRSIPERNNQPGRPRKLYELNPAGPRE